MKKSKRKTIIIELIIISLLIVCIILVSIFNDQSKMGIITYDNNMMIVKYDSVSYYDISTYGIDAGIYSESDYYRLNNVQIDISNGIIDNRINVYYTNKPLLKQALKEKMVTKNFFGNSVCFITSMDDAQLLVKKHIVLPKLVSENIAKIVIRSRDNEDVLLDNDTEINEFIRNINYYLDKLSNSTNYQEYRVYYKNTDDNIYEIINNEKIDY